jgi:hypothetical protein
MSSFPKTKPMLAVLLLALLFSMAPAHQLLQPHDIDGTTETATAAAEGDASIPATTTTETGASTLPAAAAAEPAAEATQVVDNNDLAAVAANAPAPDQAATAAAENIPTSLDDADSGQQAAAVAATTSIDSVHVALDDTYKCFCKPDELLWGCPFFPNNADLQNTVKEGCFKLFANWPKRKCGAVRNLDCSTTLAASKKILT